MSDTSVIGKASLNMREPVNATPRYGRKKIAATFFPWHSVFIDAVNQNGLLAKWTKETSNNVYFKSRIDIYSYVFKKLIGDEAVDVLEFGVSFGDSIRFFAEANTNANSRFFGFDSFEGLPERWEPGWGAVEIGAYSANGLTPNISDERVHFIKGMYQETLDEFLTAFEPQGRLFFHLDSDLYSSTLFCLVKLDYLKKHKPIIIMDDFSSPLHTFRAFRDYISAFGAETEYVAASGNYFDQVCIILS